MVFAGIDFSMSSPSICVWDSSKELKFQNCLLFNYGTWSRCTQLVGQHYNINVLKQPSYTCNEERFKNISNWVQAVLISQKVEKSSIEGYSYGSKGNTFEIGEATGQCKQVLFSLKIPFIVVEPTVAKKHATGNGNAGKDLMYNKFIEQEEVYLESLLGYDLMDDPKVIKKLETPWELKPVDDIIDSFFIMKSHPEIRAMQL